MLILSLRHPGILLSDRFSSILLSAAVRLKTGLGSYLIMRGGANESGSGLGPGVRIMDVGLFYQAVLRKGAGQGPACPRKRLGVGDGGILIFVGVKIHVHSFLPQRRLKNWVGLFIHQAGEPANDRAPQRGLCG